MSVRDQILGPHQNDDGVGRGLPSHLLPLLPRARRRVWKVTVPGLLLALAAAIGFLWFRSSSQTIDVVELAPFHVDGDAGELSRLAAGMPLTVAEALSPLADLRISGRGVAANSASVVTPAAVDRGEDRAVLRGTLGTEGDRLTLLLEMVRADTGATIWTGRYDRPAGDTLGLQQDAIDGVLNAVRPNANGDERRRVLARRTTSADAYQRLLDGRAAAASGTAADYRRALALFQDAVRADDGYGLAHAEVAESSMRLAAYRREPLASAKAAAERAVAVAPELSDSHLALGLVRMRVDWDWPAAERELKRGVELAPTSPLAHDHYALYLATLGRVPDAIVEAKRAQELEPTWSIVTSDLGWVLLLSAQPQDAVTQFRRALTLDSTSASAYEGLGIALSYTGRHDEAIANLQRALDLSDKSPVVMGDLGAAYARKGDRAAAQGTIRTMQLLPASAGVPASAIAVIYTALGEKSRALDWLERGSAARDFGMATAAVAPWFRPLRTDIRFQKIVGRLNLRD